MKSASRHEIGSAFRGCSAFHAVGDSYLLLRRLPSPSPTVELRFQFRYAAAPPPRRLSLDSATRLLFPFMLNARSTMPTFTALWPFPDRRVSTNCVSASWINRNVRAEPLNWPFSAPVSRVPSLMTAAFIA
jgi:hypothetical protein